MFDVFADVKKAAKKALHHSPFSLTAKRPLVPFPPWHFSLYDSNHELDSKVREQIRQHNETHLQIVQLLGKAAEYKDSGTGLHVFRMSRYAKILAQSLGFSDTDTELLMSAAPMHDIGKIGIPDHILLKPGRLTVDEFRVMQTHSRIGADVIGDGPSELLQMARRIALTHHERWDGAGYPNGIAGNNIPLMGRIVSIADVFDALTSERPYKDAWPVEDAVALLVREAGTHFDPDLVPCFVAELPKILAIREQFPEEAALTG